MSVTIADTGVFLRPDVTRVVSRLFVPGREAVVAPGASRAAPVIERVLQLSADEVDAAMTDLDRRFAHRHRDFHATLREHAAMVMSRIDSGVELSTPRQLLLGATFTHEYAIEGAALCNPSAVLAPVQDGSGDAAFVMSVRGIGEGHRSSIGFRTGVVTADGHVSIAPSGPFPQTALPTPGLNSRAAFRARLAELDNDDENAAYVLDAMAPSFNDADLEAHIEALLADGATRSNLSVTIANLRRLASGSYRVTFPIETDLSERVLWPHALAERQGMEDARFVRFVRDDGVVRYYGTYTAFDGVKIAQHLLETTDFLSFTASPMAGLAASEKGLALFPRKVGGRYVALSRSDRENNAIAFSDTLLCWTESRPLQIPSQAWEILQVGNCGSPIETEAGWLVLTHGVGPMRTYSLGAILLDLEEPCRVIAHTAEPILGPQDNRRDGYVPNVVYSCGAFAHGDTLVLPYGVSDQAIAIGTLSIAALIASMCPES